MREKVTCFLLAVLFVSFAPVHAQHRDKAVFVEPKNEFYDSVQAALKRFSQKPAPDRKALRMDFSTVDAPAGVSAFTQMWHTPPISQAVSGMCWCFSTTSMLESEIHRLTNRDIKLSELYTVYWEYVEKAKGFVESRGTSEFGQGSQAEAVLRSLRNHGIVPEEAYTGLLNGQPYHDHDQLFAEMQKYLMGVKEAGAWDEATVTQTIRSILNHYIGEPPSTVVVNGKKMTPQEYLKNVAKLNPDDYVAVCSFLSKPMHQMVEYSVADNWWHGTEYFNVTLDEFMAAVKRAVRNGYSLAIWGDVSEPGIEGHAGVAVIPTFDIPSEYIDASAREFRFSNGTTGDDHGIHLVGYTEKGGKDWYLIKDSGSGSRNNAHPGYYFFSEDYVKLKMLGFMVHKSAIPELVAQMPK